MPFNLVQADPALTAATAGIEKSDAAKEKQSNNFNRCIIASD